MQKVGLIIPGSSFLVDERVTPGLGILRVAAVLEQANISVDVLDLCGVQNYQEVVREYIVFSGASTIGIGATSPQMPAVAKIVQAIRKTGKSIKLIFGGPHATAVNAAARMEQKKGTMGRGNAGLQQILDMFDVVIAGDGERSIFIALRENSPHLIDGDSLDSDLFLQASEIAQYPLPARHLIDIHSYKMELDRTLYTPLIAQLGCPYGCGFCGLRLSPSFRKIRIRPIDNVLEEIRQIYQIYGFSGINFLDDELDVNPRFLGDLQEIIKLQDQLGARFRARGFLKAELITQPMADLMYQAGFRHVLIGFESGHPRILENIKKRATIDDNTRAVELCQKAGLSVKALMSIGHAGESAETIQATHDWLLKVRPEQFDVTVITCYPSTPYYDMAVPHPTGKDIFVYTATNGDKLYSENVDFLEEPQYYKGEAGQYKSFVFTDYLSREELVTMRDWLEKDVREKLGLSYYTSHAEALFDHSMGQRLPDKILKRTNKNP